MSEPRQLSTIVAEAEIPEQGLDLHLVADEIERAAIAAANGLPAVGRLEARLHVARWRSAGVAVTGRLSADVTQTCVVSLDPFEATIEDEIEIRFLPEEAMPRRVPGEEIDLAEEPEDEPELLVGGRVDLGEVVREFFVLALDPYPKKPGAEFAGWEEGQDEPSPFAALARLVKRDPESH